jgi:hypothetical protein
MGTAGISYQQFLQRITTMHSAEEKANPGAAPRPVCGIVMPISAIDGCTESHWADVINILTEAILDAGFEPNVVSNADDVGIIQKRIIQNLYDNPVVVCDVSGKNPNVMFELGLRLAFDKPTIIVKDDKTSYSFDTSPIEHLEYPRDLRFSRIVDYKEKLSSKISATYKKSISDTSYTTFLKNFGEFTVAKLDKKEVSGQEYILGELHGIQDSLDRLERRDIARESRERRVREFDLCLKGKSDTAIMDFIEVAGMYPQVAWIGVSQHDDHRDVLVGVKAGVDMMKLKDELSVAATLQKDHSVSGAVTQEGGRLTPKH